MKISSTLSLSIRLLSADFSAWCSTQCSKWDFLLGRNSMSCTWRGLHCLILIRSSLRGCLLASSRKFGELPRISFCFTKYICSAFIDPLLPLLPLYHWVKLSFWSVVMHKIMSTSSSWWVLVQCGLVEANTQISQTIPRLLPIFFLMLAWWFYRHCTAKV